MWGPVHASLRQDDVYNILCPRHPEKDREKSMSCWYHGDAVAVLFFCQQFRTSRVVYYISLRLRH